MTTNRPYHLAQAAASRQVRVLAHPTWSARLGMTKPSTIKGSREGFVGCESTAARVGSDTIRILGALPT